MDTSQKTEPDERECRREEEESWSEGKQEDMKTRSSEIHATTITIHLVMRPMTTEDKTQSERTDLGDKEAVEKDDGEEMKEGVEGHQRKGGEKEKEQRSIGTQTTQALERVAEGSSEPSEGRQTRELNIQSLPPEICLKIIDYLPDIKTRFSLRRVCPEFRNLIDARVCWKSRSLLIIEVREGGWWFSVNECRVSGSRKQPKFKIFHSFKRIKGNVCEGIRAIFSRINVRKIIISGVDYLTDTDILLTLAEEILKHEQITSDRQLHSVKLFGHCRITQPLLFWIFVPVASGLDIFSLVLKNPLPKLSISGATEEAVYRLIKCCTRLRSVCLWPVISLRCLEAIKGRPIKGLCFDVLDKASIHDVLEPQLVAICDSIHRTLTDLYLFGQLYNTLILSNLNNKQFLRTAASGSLRSVNAVNGRIAQLASFPNLRHILFLFRGHVSSRGLVSMVTTLFNSFHQQDRAKIQPERRISFRVECDKSGSDNDWPQESVRQALQEQQIEVLETSIRPITSIYSWWAERSSVTWLELRRENVSVSLYCDCVSK